MSQSNCTVRGTPDSSSQLRCRLLGWLTGLLAVAAAGAAIAADAGVVYEGKEGPGKGKHIVLVAGDEEYRSEEAMPMLAKILAVRHGFKCTVLFSINPDDGTIDPNNQTHIPGLEVLDTADMMVVFLRFRELPDEEMKYFDRFVNSGKPILGLRTATHAFAYSRNKNSPYARYDWRNKEWPNGFGQQVLGETWVNHHGHHRFESTRGVINEALKDHPDPEGRRGHLGTDRRVHGQEPDPRGEGAGPRPGAGRHEARPTSRWPGRRTSR